jgi:hypothetical protein
MVRLSARCKLTCFVFILYSPRNVRYALSVPASPTPPASMARTMIFPLKMDTPTPQTRLVRPCPVSRRLRHRSLLPIPSVCRRAVVALLIRLLLLLRLVLSLGLRQWMWIRRRLRRLRLSKLRMGCVVFLFFTFWALQSRDGDSLLFCLFSFICGFFYASGSDAVLVYFLRFLFILSFGWALILRSPGVYVWYEFRLRNLTLKAWLKQLAPP